MSHREAEQEIVGCAFEVGKRIFKQSESGLQVNFTEKQFSFACATTDEVINHL